MITKPTFKEAFLFWLKLGFISFGGPAGQVAIMHEFLVEKKRWISDTKFLHALNYCMILPGPEAQQLATYVGWLLHGTRGGLAAGILFVLPSVFILLGLSIFYVMFGTIPEGAALFYGLKPAVVAIVILALIKIGKKSLQSSFHYSLAALSFVGIFFFDIPFPALILAAITLGIIIEKYFPSLLTSAQSSKITLENESSYYLNTLHQTHRVSDFSIGKIIKQIFVALFLWFIPLGILYNSVSDFNFWRTLSLFFTKAALVTFGGAYAVLPYVAQVSVEKLHWLNKLEMIDGLALGETTPGPLIMVLAFVGFMAGYNHYVSIAMGSLALLITTFYTFLPSILFILIGAPIVEKTQDNSRLKSLLSIVTAVVVGVVLNLTIYFTLAVIFPKGIANHHFDFVSLAWILVSFVSMYNFKINMILWIAISGLFGLLKYYLFNF